MYIDKFITELLVSGFSNAPRYAGGASETDALAPRRNRFRYRVVRFPENLLVATFFTCEIRESDMRQMEVGNVVENIHLDVRTAITAFCALVALYLLYRVLRTDPEDALELSVPSPEQCESGWKGQTLDQPSIKVSGSTAIQCYAPATGQLLGLINPTTPDGIDRIVSKASEAQVEWAKTSFTQRRRVLRTLLKYLLDNQEPIARAACLDSGKTRVDALFGELLVTAEKLQWTISNGEKALKSERRPTNRLMFYKRNEVHYEPLGVVGACVSWKYVMFSMMKHRLYLLD